MTNSIDALERIVSYLRKGLHSDRIVARLTIAVLVTAPLLLRTVPQAEARRTADDICHCPPGLCHCFPGDLDDPLPRPSCYCEEPSMRPASIRSPLPASRARPQYPQSRQDPQSGQAQSGPAAVP
jgi:hypothetical protein